MAIPTRLPLLNNEFMKQFVKDDLARDMDKMFRHAAMYGSGTMSISAAAQRNQPPRRYRLLIEVELEALNESAAKNRASSAFSTGLGGSATTVLMCEPIIDDKPEAKP